MCGGRVLRYFVRNVCELLTRFEIFPQHFQFNEREKRVFFLYFWGAETSDGASIGNPFSKLPRKFPKQTAEKTQNKQSVERINSCSRAAFPGLIHFFTSSLGSISAACECSFRMEL
jgi:hypothetical protein